MFPFHYHKKDVGTKEFDIMMLPNKFINDSKCQ